MRSPHPSIVPASTGNQMETSGTTDNNDQRPVERNSVAELEQLVAHQKVVIETLTEGNKLEVAAKDRIIAALKEELAVKDRVLDTRQHSASNVPTVFIATLGSLSRKIEASNNLTCAGILIHIGSAIKSSPSNDLFEVFKTCVEPALKSRSNDPFTHLLLDSFWYPEAIQNIGLVKGMYREANLHRDERSTSQTSVKNRFRNPDHIKLMRRFCRGLGFNLSD